MANTPQARAAALHVQFRDRPINERWPLAGSTYDQRWGDDALKPPTFQLLERLWKSDIKVDVERSPAAPVRSVNSITATSSANVPVVPGYTILDCMESGGFGTVYRARSLDLNQELALKVCKPVESFLGQDVQRQVLEDEIKQLVKLPRDPHLVLIRGAGLIENGGRYLAMEFVGGKETAPNLENLATKPVESRLAAECVAVIAHALHKVHEAGVLHLDVKPHNVLVKGDAICAADLVLGDFGAAREFDLDTGQLTIPGRFGTPGYAAPEWKASDGQRLTRASDVYSAGAMLHRLLFGQVPQQPIDATAVTSPLWPTPIPKDLSAILAKSLAAGPQQRYQTADELARDLDRFVRGEPTSVYPRNVLGRTWLWCWREPTKAMLTVTMLGLLVIAVIAAFIASEKDRDEAQAQVKLVSAEAEKNREIASKQLAEKEAARALAAQKEEEALRVAAEANEKTAKLEAQKATQDAQLRDDIFYRQQTATLLRDGRVTEARLRTAQRLVLAPDRNPLSSAQQTIYRVGLGILSRGMSSPRTTFFEHGPVRAGDLSPDGSLLATVCSAKGTVRIWDVETASPKFPTFKNATPAPMNDARFSPDGRWLMGVSRETPSVSWIHLWDVQTGKPATPAIKIAGPVIEARFNVEGSRLIIVTMGLPGFFTSADGEARVLDVPSLKLVGKPLKNKDGFSSGVFSPDGKRIAAGAMNGLIHVWDLESGQPVGSDRKLKAPVAALAFSPDGTHIAAATNFGSARVFQTETGEAVTPQLVHAPTIIKAPVGPGGQGLAAVSFSPNGQFLLTSCGDKTVRLWVVPSGEPFGKPMQHDGDVTSIAFAPDGQRIVTASTDNSTRLWKLDTQPIGSRMEHGHQVHRAVFSRSGREVVSFSEDSTVCLWDVSRDPPRWPPLDGGSKVVAISPRGTLAIKTRGRSVSIATASGDALSAEIDCAHEVKQAAISTDDSCAIVASGSVPGDSVGATILRIHRTEGGQLRLETQRTLPVVHDIQHVAISANGGHVALCTVMPAQSNVGTENSPRPSKVSVWNRDAGDKPIAEWDHQAATSALSFSEDNQWLASASLLGPVKLFRMDPPNSAPQEIGEKLGFVASLCFDRTGLLIGRDDGALVWDIGKKQQRGQLMTHPSRLTGAVISPDGTTVLTLGMDRVARLWRWNSTSGQWTVRNTSEMGHRTELRGAMFSPSGNLVATHSVDGVARVWETGDGTPVSTAFEHVTSFVEHMKFSADERELLAINGGQVWRWDLSPAVGTPEELLRLAEMAAGRRVLPSGVEMPVDWRKDAAYQRQLFAARPEQWWLAVTIARTEAANKQWSEARKYFELAVSRQDKDSELWVELAEVARNLKHYRRATEAAQAAIKLNGGDSRAFNSLGMSQVRCGKNSESIESFTEAHQRDLFKSGFPLMGRAIARGNLREWDQSANDYDEFLRTASQSFAASNIPFGARTQRASIWLAKGDLPKFKTTMEELLKEYATESAAPDALESLAWTAVLTPETVSDWKPIVALAERAVDGSADADDFPIYLTTLGIVRFRVGLFDAAAQSLEAALCERQRRLDAGREVSNSPAFAWLFLARIEHQRGHASKSQELWRRATEHIERELNPPSNDNDSDVEHILWPRRLAYELFLKEAAMALPVSAQ